MENAKSKTPADSAVETRHLVMPGNANPFGTAFGGAIASWVDIAASMCAQKHCEKEVVTASIDSLNFKEPIFVGDQVVLKASVNYVGRTSMEVGVKVIRENPLKGISAVTTTAHLTFVALDENKKPSLIPPLNLVTDQDKRRFQNAKIRVQARKELLKKINNE